MCHAFGEPLVVEEVELDAPRPGEVRVRVAACAVCHSDVAYASGAWGGSVPAIYGHEAAGVVEEVGGEAGELRPGDHVVVTLVRVVRCLPHLPPRPAGAVRDALRARRAEPAANARAVTRSPRACAPPHSPSTSSCTTRRRCGFRAELPLDRACLLACGVVTGYGAVVNTAGMAAGDSAVVIGAGGVGLNCIQAAALAGAEPIVAIDLAAERLATRHRVRCDVRRRPGRR